MGCGKYGRAFLHSLSTEQLINPELNQLMNQKLIGAAHFLDIIRPVEYKLTVRRALVSLTSPPHLQSHAISLSICIYLFLSLKVPSYHSLARSLARLISVQQKHGRKPKNQAARRRPNQRSLLPSWTPSLLPSLRLLHAEHKRAFRRIATANHLLDFSTTGSWRSDLVYRQQPSRFRVVHRGFFFFF